MVLQVLVAYSPSYYFGLHAWMHSQEINLVADHPHKHSSVSGEMYEDIVMPDFLVPNDDATQVYKLRNQIRTRSTICTRHLVFCL